MRKTALFAAVCAALTLAGCDGGSSPAGAGAGTSETNTSSVNEAVAREKALTVARQNGTAMELQLAGLIIEAAQELRPRYQGKFNAQLDSMVCALGLDPKQRGTAREGIEQEIGGVIIPGMELGIFATGTQADFNAACLASFWPLSVQPINGWPQTRARAFSQEANGEMAHWGANQLVGALATSASLAPIANSLSKMPGATVEELRAKARELLTENANAYRELSAQVAREYVGRDSEVSLDFTGQSPAPVHLTLAGFDLQLGPSGALVSQNGTTRFGSGYLEGVRYTVEAVTTRGQTLTRSSSRTTSSESANASAVNAEARTQ